MKPYWLICVAACAALLAGVFAAPFLASAGRETAANTAYMAYSGFCHQLSERSYSVFGHQMAVCARCLGIYAGLLAGAVTYPLIWGFVCRRVVVVAAVLPMIADGATQLTGLRESSNTLRLVTGLLFGLVAGAYMAYATQKVSKCLEGKLFKRDRVLDIGRDGKEEKLGGERCRSGRR